MPLDMLDTSSGPTVIYLTCMQMTGYARVVLLKIVSTAIVITVQ